MDSPGGKGGRCVRLTTYHPCSVERQEIRGLYLPGPPWAISTACCVRDLYLYLFHSVLSCTVVVLNYTFVILTCFVIVWVCVCVGFLMCGCLGHMCTRIYCVLYCLYCVFCIVSFMYIYSYLFCL